MRKDKGLAVVAELLSHNNDRVIRAMSGALRNLAIDPFNRDLLGKPWKKKVNREVSEIRTMDVSRPVLVLQCVFLSRLGLVRSKSNTFARSEPAQRCSESAVKRGVRGDRCVRVEHAPRGAGLQC